MNGTLGLSVRRGLSVLIAVSSGFVSTAYAELVAHWTLDEGDGEEFEDVAGGFDGFLPDGMTIEWDDGPPTQDYAVKFLGADSFIATEFPGIGGNEPRSVAFWLKTSEADAYMLGWGANAAGQKWHIRLNGASGVMRTEFQGGQNFSGIPVNDGEWHHVVSVFPDGAIEGSEIRHYVDGVLDPQVGGTSIPINTAVGEGLADWTDANSFDAYDVHFGAVLAHGFGRMLEGSMADIRIYDEELSEDEIIEIMEGEDPVPPVKNFKRGDSDASGIVDISDPIFNLTFQFVGGIARLPCEDAADVDDSGVLDLSDPIFNLTFQFVSGIVPPPAPGEKVCGPDPTDDERSCEAYPQEKC